MTTSVVQSGPVSTTVTAASIPVTITAPSTAGNALFLWGILGCSVAGASVTLAVTDDKGNTWVVDATSDPGGGDGHKCFIASCLNPTTGTQVLTLTATGGTIVGTISWAEANGITGKNGFATASSAGSGQASPLVLSNAAVNREQYSLVLHAFSTSAFNAATGATCSTPIGSMTGVAVQTNGTGAAAAGWSGYHIDTWELIDSVTDTWTAGNTVLGRVLGSYAGTPPGPNITVQPVAQYAAAGGTVTFSVTATSNGGALSYQWQFYDHGAGTWSDVGGATSSSYTTGTLTAADANDDYRCKVTDSTGDRYSAEADIWITGLGSMGDGAGLQSAWIGGH